MDRQVDAVELGYFVNEVQERGAVMCVSTGGSGIALDSPSNVATCKFNTASGQLPLGLLMNDFVNIDLTRTPINWYKDQAVSGDKATLLTKGWIVTNLVIGNPVAGQLAVVASGGYVSGIAQPITNVVNFPVVGRFRSGLSEEGYARVNIDL